MLGGKRKATDRDEVGGCGQESRQVVGEGLPGEKHKSEDPIVASTLLDTLASMLALSFKDNLRSWW